MKTTGFIALFLAFFLTLNAFGQTKSGIIATFDSKAPVIKTENNQILSTFNIQASEKQIKDIKATSLKFSKWSVTTISDTKNADGKYTCTITFSSKQKDNQFLLKMLYDFNVESFIYNNTNHKIKKFDSVVK